MKIPSIRTILVIYAVLILLTCFFAVPVSYYQGDLPNPINHGYSTIWSRVKTVTYNNNGMYSGMSYTIKVDQGRVWIQIVGFTLLAGTAMLLLKEKRDTK